MVASVHCPDLWNSDVALVDEGHEIVREIVNEAERPLAFLSPVQISGIILDSGAVAHLLDHFQVVFHPLLQPFGLHRTAQVLEMLNLPDQVVLNHAHGPDGLLLCRHEIARRINRHFAEPFDSGSRDRLDKRQ